MPPSPFDELLESVRASLHARRSELADQVRQIETRLREYEQAVDRETAAHFAEEHGLRLPSKGVSAKQAAQALAELVLALPELRELAAPTATVDAEAPRPLPAKHPKAAAPEAAPTPTALRLLGAGKLVIIGGISGREKSSALSSRLAEHLEWIDTERDGVRAVGNLPQRIRQGRVGGVVILDRAVSHKHTDPVLAAARDARVPVAFAGQGGKASLARALAQIEQMLRERA
jgi:hypothetical protein